MDHANSVVCICETHEEAERAMYNLQAAGINMGTLSVTTRDMSTDVHKVDYYDPGEETFSIPGIGCLLVEGPLASWIVTAFTNSKNGDGVSIVGTALATLGVPSDGILKYDAALTAGKHLLIVHGSPDAVASALAAIGGTVHCFDTIHGDKVSDTLHVAGLLAKPGNTYQA